LSAIGHPIVGDTMYGGRPMTHGDFHFERQALHAFQITLVHPATLKMITLEAPLPSDMKRLLEIVRGN
jgi:23S rRNA-/tRNA-specific pseudouridylate synthase